MGRAYARLLASRGVLPKVALGLLSGFLPCMFSFLMIVKSAATGSLLSGFLTMLLFGAGTVPVLFFTGLSASLLSFKLRILGSRVAGGMVMAMGVMLILRGVRHFL
jgi:sulfite exporter TauE/SafE